MIFSCPNGCGKELFSVVIVLVIFGFLTTLGLYATIYVGLWSLMLIPITLVCVTVTSLITRNKTADTQIEKITGNANITRTGNVIGPGNGPNLCTISRPTFDKFSLQRYTSLPSYDQVLINQPNYEIDEEPLLQEDRSGQEEV